ncbi:FkbM family methyltransferase [Buttiauxella warmboldiae]|nr:FkbM family methyltransferase [Buttiauxella warmboldiae]
MNVDPNLKNLAIDDKIKVIKDEFSNDVFNILEFTHNYKKVKLFHLDDDYLPSRIIADKKFYECDFLNFFSFFNADDHLVIDVGANIGNHSIYFSLVKNWDVIAFEPVRKNALCFSINADLNNVSEKVTLLETALGKCEGSVLLSKSIGDNNGTFSRDANKNNSTIKVSIMVLDDISQIKNSERSIGLIKIDVEGMEYDVLQGSVNTLKKHKPALAFECITHKDYTDIMNLLSPLGYFPVEVLNATATFICLNKYNNIHMEKVSEYLTMYTEQRKIQEYKMF